MNKNKLESENKVKKTIQPLLDEYQRKTGIKVEYVLFSGNDEFIAIDIRNRVEFANENDEKLFDELFKNVEETFQKLRPLPII